MAEILGPEDERQEIEQVSPSALAVLAQSEHASMVATANTLSNRRKLVDFESKLMSYATHSQPIALSMFYSLPRAGKQIIGPSVRFAEVVAPCWKNCAVGARVMGAMEGTVTAQGVFIDYENNLRNSIEVPRRVTDKDGKRFSDDMIVTTMNAAMSVARRNSVLKGGVPQALWTPAYEQAQLTAVGKALSHEKRVADAMEYLNKLGVTEFQILGAVGVPSIKELETEHLVTLRVLCGEIKRGDKTIEEVFGSQYDKEIEAAFVQLGLNQAQQTMLRNSYRGRVVEFVSYLRERLGKQTRPAEPPKGSGQSVEERVAQASTPAANAKQEHVYVSEVRTWPSVKAFEEELKPSPSVEFSFGANEAPDAHLWTDDEVAEMKAEGVIEENSPLQWDKLDPERKPQTSMEPGNRRRGRPTREEAARKAAATVKGPEPDARKEVERLIESTDKFAF